MSSSYHSADSALTRILKYASRSEAAAMQATISRLQSAADCGPDVAALDALGTALLAANRASEAVEHLFQAATLAPEDAGILHRLGSAQIGCRKFAEAERSLTRALSMLAVHGEPEVHPPLEPRIRTKLGISLLELKRDRDAATV
ncbi:MAG: hypothetical protein QGG40_20500, partial [Myxococcota bacterium]|nr:hypothetical protein [Myxococcota bacterium]